jgi:hypothetical protein
MLGHENAILFFSPVFKKEQIIGGQAGSSSGGGSHQVWGLNPQKSFFKRKIEFFYRKNWLKTLKMKNFLQKLKIIRGYPYIFFGRPKHKGEGRPLVLCGFRPVWGVSPLP